MLYDKYLFLVPPASSRLTEKKSNQLENLGNRQFLSECGFVSYIGPYYKSELMLKSNSSKILPINL